MELTDVIAMYERAADSQLKYWNVYWLVSISILGVLWKEKRTKGLKIVLIAGFVFFAGSNLLAVYGFQNDLIELSKGINLYIDNNPQKISEDFNEQVKRTPLRMWKVVAFHVLSSVFFLIALCVAKTEELA